MRIKRSGSLWACIIMLAFSFGALSKARAVYIDLPDEYSDTSLAFIATIGMAMINGNPRATMCVNDTDLFALRADLSEDALDEDVEIFFGTSADLVAFVRAGEAVPSSRDCGITSWFPLVFNGYEVDIDLDNGINQWEGPTGSPELTATGGNSSDYFYIFSTTGHYRGRDGADNFRSVSTATGLERYNGGNGDDCFQDDSDSLQSITCGDGNDAHNLTIAVPTNCENYHSRLCCGLC